MSDVLTKQQRSYCMSRIQGKNTTPELLLRKVLWLRGFRYRLKNSLPGRPDIVYPGRHLVIFVDGCFWHGCPEHYQMPEVNRTFWEEKMLKTKARDKDVNRMLKQNGWKVLRFWEHEIKTDLSGCVDQVSQKFQESNLN